MVVTYHLTLNLFGALMLLFECNDYSICRCIFTCDHLWHMEFHMHWFETVQCTAVRTAALSQFKAQQEENAKENMG